MLAFPDMEAATEIPEAAENGEEHTDSQEIDEFIQAQKSENTVKKPRSDMKTFYMFCKSIKEHRRVEFISVNELDKILCKFF